MSGFSSKSKTVFFAISMVFLSAPVAFAGNPVTPIVPGDNIQDPGALSTPWGGCGPSDSNCYVTISSGGSSALSSITAATTTNTINNGTFAQEWQWNSLAGNTGLKLSSSSTAAASNAQKLFEVTTAGANATATQTTYGASFSNTHTGTSSTNIALYATASGGTNNIAGFFENGSVGIGSYDSSVPLFVSSVSDTTLLKLFRSNGDAGISFGVEDLATDIARIQGQLDNSPADLLLNPAGGNIGIGTTTPRSELHVAGLGGMLGRFVNSGSLGPTGGGTLSLQTGNLPNAANQQLGYLTFGTDNNGDTPWVGAAISAYSQAGWVDGVSSPGYLVFDTVGAGSLAVSERMRLTSEGELLVGTTSVGAKFTVSGSSGGNSIRATNVNGDYDVAFLATGTSSSGTNFFQGMFSSPEGVYGTIQNTNAAALASANLLLDALGGDAFTSYSVGGGVTSWSVGVDTSDSDKFKIGRASQLGVTDMVTIDENGNVGIGTTTPTETLHVYRNEVGNYHPQMVMQDGLSDGMAQIGLEAVGARWHFGVGSTGATYLGDISGDFFIWSETSSAVRLKLKETTGVMELTGGTPLADTSAMLTTNVTLANDTDVDTISGITVNATSAATGDADILYGINIAGITAQSVVNETGLRVGSGWDYAAVFDGRVGINTTTPTATLDVGANVTTMVLGNQNVNANTSSLTWYARSGGGFNIAATWTARNNAYYALDVNAFTDAIRVDTSTGKVAFTRGMEGDSSYNGKLSIGTVAPADENEGLFVVSKGFSTTSGNHHAIRVISTDAALATGAGIAAYDGLMTISSTNNLDHFVDFQARSQHTGSGTITDIYGFYSVPGNSGGTATRLTHMDINDYTGGGVVTTQYGVRVHQLSNAGTNYAIYTDGTTQSYFGGSVGIGDPTPDYAFDVEKTGSDTNIFSLTDSDGACLHNPESGAETVTCSSDERLKTNIVDANSALAYFKPFRIREYTVIASGDHMTGVIAQEVLQTNPELVSLDQNGMYSVQLPNQWQVVKAIQELDATVTSITSLTEGDNSFVQKLRNWLADISNGITKIFSDEIETKQLCVSDDSGAKTCITKGQLDTLLQGGSQNSGGGTPPPQDTPPVTPDPEPQPDVVPPPANGEVTP